MNEIIEQVTSEAEPKTPTHNGRRQVRDELRARWHWLDWNRNSPMLTVAMAPRKLRREKQGKNFRPVYGYVGPVGINKEVVVV